MRKTPAWTITAAILIAFSAVHALSQTNSIIGQIDVVGRSDPGGVTVWVDSVRVTETYPTGYYRIDVPAGTYTVHAWDDYCLARIIGTVTVIDRNVTGVDGELFAGDLLPDGRIDLHDVRVLLNHYMETPDSSGWDERCDIHTDQVIDSLDIELMASRWRESADSRLPDWPDEPLEVVEPDGSTIWNIVGQENLPIRWISAYLGGEVSIDLYRWGEKVATIAESTENDGEFILSELPAGLQAGDSYQVHVFKSEESQDFSESFSLEDPMLIYLPDSETTWFLGEQDVSIEWHPGYETGNVSIFLMTWDTIVDTIAASTANDGLFEDYDVPLSLTANGGYRVEIVTGTGTVAKSDNFGIRQMITVYYPDSTSVWRPGTTYGVQCWNRAGLTSTISLYLYKGEELRYTIVEGMPYNQYTFIWVVPGDIESGGDYRVMARYDDLPEIFDLSDYFDIRPGFRVLKPNRYSYWFMGEKGIAVEWEDAGLDGNVSITLYKGSSAIDVITGATENDGVYVDYNYAVTAAYGPDDDFSVRVFYSADINGFSKDFKIVRPPAEANLGWNSISHTATLRDVYIGGPAVAAAVGELGEIIWTSDGGNTWAGQESGTYYTLYGVSLNGDLTGTAVGTDGLILQTVDGGQNWERRRFQFAKTLRDVSQIDAGTAIAVGENGTIIRIIEGGADWEILPSGVSGRLHAVHFIDENSGWAGGGSGTMIRTSDGGDTWTTVDIGSTGHIQDISFHDGNIGAVTQYNIIEYWYIHSIMMTDDGGSTWQSSTFGSGFENSSAIAFANSSTLTATSLWMVHSTDGGDTWIDQPDELFDVLYGIDYIPGGKGFTVGSSGVVLRTDNSGDTWLPARAGITHLVDVDHVDSDTAAAVGHHGLIMRTTDGGINWTGIDSGTGSDLLSVSFDQEGRGIATGTDRSILWTFDGGLSWMPTWPALAPSSIYGTAIVDYPAVVAVGETGRIIRTGDGGVSWAVVSSGTSVTLRAASFIDAYQGIVVGYTGTVLRTSDGGVTWNSQSSGTTEDLYDVEFIDASNGMAVGSSGTILRTSDGGGTWTALSSGTSVTLVSVEYSYPYGVTVVGEDGTILRTTDSGDSWYIQQGGTTRDLMGVSFSGVMDGIIVGLDGTILQTTTAGQ